MQLSALVQVVGLRVDIGQLVAFVDAASVVDELKHAAIVLVFLRIRRVVAAGICLGEPRLLGTIVDTLQIHSALVSSN